MIRLETATGDPWSLHPQLATIWPEPSNTHARRASEEDSETGEIMLIKYGHDVIGITGLFTFPEDFLNVYLRWHGIVPEFRRKGYATDAVRLVSTAARIAYPHRHNLVELAPVNRVQYVQDFFITAGFTRHTEQVEYGDEMAWPMLFNLKG